MRRQKIGRARSAKILEKEIKSNKVIDLFLKNSKNKLK